MAASIRTTLIRQITLIMVVVSVAVLLSIAALSLYTSRAHRESSEKQFLKALLSKGNTLVVSNSQALINMVNDNSFSSIRNLISAPVRTDPDIVYGVFMDTNRRPWVIVNHNSPDGQIVDAEILDDPLSDWAASLKRSGYTIVDLTNPPAYTAIDENAQSSRVIYEISAPVYSRYDDADTAGSEVFLGTIRYGITTAQIEISRLDAEALSRRLLFYTLLILVLLGIIAFVFAYMATRYATTLIIKPLDDLSKATLDIAQGNYDNSIVIDSDNEVGVLSRSFNSMRIKIKQVLEQLLEHQDVLKIKNQDLEIAQAELEDLNKSLEDKVIERTAELKAVQKELVDTARQAGMAEIAINVLHNIGNVINSVNVANQDNFALLKRSKVTILMKTNELIQANRDNIGEYISNDVKGSKIPDLLDKLGLTLGHENQLLLENSNRMMQGIGIIGNIISTQEKYAQTNVYNEEYYIQSIIDEALEVQTATFNKHSIRVSTDIREVPAVIGDRSKLHQIITNLFVNAHHALLNNGLDNRNIMIRLFVEDETIKLIIKDNGSGIPEGSLIDIFQHGFTTKKSGHGFGLHSCANFIGEMGGSIMASSAGLGKGASFTIELPVQLYSVVDTSSESDKEQNVH